MTADDKKLLEEIRRHAWYQNDEHSKFLITKLDEAHEALKVITYTNRSRGYPTGSEWGQIIKIVHKVLGEE